MDSKENIDIKAFISKPYVKYTLIITIIIILLMYLTQSYWISSGIKSLYTEYKAEDILLDNNIPDGVFILSGNYTYISERINTSKFVCNNNDDVKFLAISKKEFGEFKNVIIVDAIEGCKKIWIRKLKKQYL